MLTASPDHVDPGALPPQDLAAEQAVLGGMLLSQYAIGEVTEILEERDFYLPTHGRVFSAILHLYAQGEPADPITIAAALQRDGALARIGGHGFLHTLIASVPTAVNAAYYAQIVAQKAILRRLVEAGTRIAQFGLHGVGGANVTDIVDRAEATLFKATAGAKDDARGPVTGAQAATTVLAMLEETTPRDLVRTGLRDLDDIIGGLEPGELTVICGRPGHGKTLLGLQIARHAALEQGKHVLILSLEMSQTLLMQRMLAAIPPRGIALDRVSKKPGCPLSEDDRRQLTAAHERLQNAALWVDDASYHTSTTIRSTIRRHTQQHGHLDLVVIDHLGLVSATGRQETRALELARLTRDLKVFAGELDIPIVPLHQLNRQSTQRLDRRPQLADLRDSGAVEQDAFAVIGVHTPAVDDPTDPHAGESDHCVIKSRQGRTGIAHTAWQAHYARFANLAK